MIEISDSNKILILMLLVGLVIYLLSDSSKKSEPIHNQGSLQQSLTNSLKYIDTDSLPNNIDNLSMDSENSESQNSANSESQNSANSEFQNSVADIILSQNLKTVNYADSDRNQVSNLDNFFNNENPLDQPSNGFVSTSNGQNYASYTSGTGEKQQDDDKFDSSALLPQEKKDWFDDPQAKKGINSPHLINIYRATGVNTVQTTLKNASWDIRGAPPNPKYVVSPWGNSSYEPDNNLKNGSLCI
jgi:hypothetical protein